MVPFEPHRIMVLKKKPFKHFDSRLFLYLLQKRSRHSSHNNYLTETMSDGVIAIISASS